MKNLCIYRQTQLSINGRDVGLCTKPYKPIHCYREDESLCKFSIIIVGVCDINTKKEYLATLSRNGMLCKI